MKLSLILVALSLAGTGSLRAAAVLTFIPPAQTVFVGNTAQVQVKISGLGQAAPPSLGAYDLTLSFDPALFLFSSLTFGDPMLGDQLDLSGLGSINDFSLQSPGHLEFFEISLDPSSVLDSQQAGAFTLATIRFKATAPGMSLLATSLNSVSDAAGASFSLGQATGSLTAVAAPEPATFGLLAFSGACVGLVTRRRRNAFTYPAE